MDRKRSPRFAARSLMFTQVLQWLDEARKGSPRFATPRSPSTLKVPSGCLKFCDDLQGSL